jgi:hypothetical protein
MWGPLSIVGIKRRNFPVFSPETGNTSGDGFADDCLHRQRSVPRIAEPVALAAVAHSPPSRAVFDAFPPLAAAGVPYFSLQTVSKVSQLSRAKASIVETINYGERGIAMRVFIACAIIISAAIGLAGCFGHHEKAVMAEPLKLS